MKIPGIFNPNTTYTLLDYDHIQELVSEGLSDDIIKILSQIEATYPFTFLEKEGIRQKIDKLDNFIWIKNRYGFLELVNQKLAEYFDMSFGQLEGNHEELFFPVDARQTIKSFNNIACETKKPVRLEEIGFIDKELDAKFNLINYPIIDLEDTVIGIICLSVNPKTEKKSEKVENYSRKLQNLSQLPFAAAILSGDGLIANSNTKFRELISSDYSEVENPLINDVFRPKFVEFFKEFISSKSKEITVKSTELFQKQTFPINILLGKIFDENNQTAAILLGVKNEGDEKFAAEHQKNLGMIENLIRNNPDAVLICDKENLKFIEVNEVAINLYGYRRDEFLQMDLTDLYSAEDIQLLLDSSSANVKEGSFHGPYKHKKKDGSVILVEMSRYSVKFQEREAHFNLVRNITEKLEVEKRNQSYKSAFENTDDLIFITDSSGFIRSINQQVTKVLGFTKNDLINSSFTTLVSDEDRSRINLSIFHSNKKDESSLSINFKTVEGRFLLVDIIVSPIIDLNKEIEAFTLIGKVKESVLSPESEALKTKSGDSSLDEAIDSKYLAELFHELLTPVNVILGFAQDITDSIDQPTAEQKEASEIIKQNRTNLLQSMNAAVEYASLSEKGLNLFLAETKITDVIDQLLKDILELKGSLDVEFAYGKISSSLKFETDRQRFKYFLLLLLKITTKLSRQRKIYFSAYALDKDYFLVTFRDLQTHCSKSLVNNLNSIFQSNEIISNKKFEVSKITLRLVQKLLNILKGKFVILSDEKDKNDYGIVLPIAFSKAIVEEIKQTTTVDKSDLEKEITDTSSNSEKKNETITSDSQPELGEKSKLKANSKESEEAASKLQNELKMEALREKIRRREVQKKPKKIEEEDASEDSEEDEFVEDTIEFFDLDLKEDLDDEIEEEIEVIETSAPKEKTVEKPKTNQTDEKVDISNLSCLYFEDQIDSQVLFRVQMKGLKNLNFAVSFEESLPLLDSGNYDFIVIDINLQGSYNGLDIMRILRTMPRYENTPVFAVTAYVLPGDQHKFVLAGFSGFISKPIFRDQMIDVLAEVFNEQKHS
jgi:PAS domain S-box-containing protein